MKSTLERYEPWHPAVFSRDRRYRFYLSRVWDEWEPECCFVMLNPSTADERRDDPTIRRCVGYAKRWGYGGLVVVNLFALRSTRPDELYRASYPVGARNDWWISRTVADARLTVLAWGNHGTHRSRAADVLRLVRPYAHKVRVLSVTKAGQPGHPLYLPADADLRAWDWDEVAA